MSRLFCVTDLGASLVLQLQLQLRLRMGGCERQLLICRQGWQHKVGASNNEVCGASTGGAVFDIPGSSIRHFAWWAITSPFALMHSGLPAVCHSCCWVAPPGFLQQK